MTAGVVLMTLVGLGAAQGPTIGVEVRPRPATVGDRITIVVTVEHAPTDSVVWPEIVDRMGSFDVIDAELLRPVLADDRVRSALQLTVTAFELGDLSFPALSVPVVSDAGDRTTELATDSLIVPVQSVGLDEGGDIRDIKPPLTIARSRLRLVLWVLLFGLVGAAAFLAYHRFRNRPVAAPTPPPAGPPRPPHEVAFEALARLELTRLHGADDIARFHVDASHIVREYLHGRFGVDAMEMDSHDIMDALKRHVGFEVQMSFDEFLGRCDLVKFAKQRPSPEVCREVVELARRLVERTRPAPAAPARVESS